MTAPLQILAQAFTGRLLNAGVEGILVAGLVWIFLRVAKRQNSGTRFVIWFSALLAIVSLPLLSGTFFSAQGGLVPNAHPRILLAGFVASYLFATWVAVAGFLLLRLTIGLLRLLQVRRNCVAVDLATLDPEIATVCRNFKSARRATLCTSDDVTIPAAIGFFRPAVVFPAHLFARLSKEEVKAILLHELAHLRRWDDLTNLAQQFLKAVFFFHPAVWWIDNHLTLEREMACDDVVLAETNSPRVYASSLISFTEKLQNSRRPALVQALVSRVRHMTLRIAQILSPRRPGNIALWKPALGVSTTLIATVLLATPYLPTLVAFRPDAPAHSLIQASHIPSATTAVAVQKTIASPQTTPRARAIAAAFHPRARAASQSKLSASSQPRIMRTSFTPNDLPVPNTVVIFQTTRYESAGREIWTLSVWRVGGNDWSNRQLESAWIVSSI
jgi:beta-lactamase regulating signal transducer with metallopeptidase domain